MELYKNYARSAGDAPPYLRRPYRAHVVFDPTSGFYGVRAVVDTVPSRQFSNILSTGCGALGAAITALANARCARIRTRLQHTHATLGVADMRTSAATGPLVSPSGGGWVPPDAPTNLAFALQDGVAAAEYAVTQAFHELEGRLKPYEAFRVLPPGDARRDAPPPADEAGVFRHAASIEVARKIDRIINIVHTQDAAVWPQAGTHPLDTLADLSAHVYTLLVPRVEPTLRQRELEERRMSGLRAAADEAAAHKRAKLAFLEMKEQRLKRAGAVVV